uniref:Ribosomal protein S17 n=1 Tax=Spumella sp. NIES-1846 TaxID=2490549 RepID=A0A455RF17_9STRA|nr:ribosomal protein S17 [Spumella sp. NIES-1846]
MNIINITKYRIGLVINKTQKTVKIQFKMFFFNKLLKKKTFKTKYYQVHDPFNICTFGDIILIKKISPISTLKSWKLSTILIKEKNLYLKEL